LLVFSIVSAHRKVKLSDVKTLTLSHGSFTTGRRSSPIPQLTCIGGSAGCTNLPPSVQCYNRGSDGIDIQWECKADLPKSLKFGHIEVACEGYDYPDDPYILQGSCGLEYKLERTGHGYGEDSTSYRQKLMFPAQTPCSYYGQKGKPSSFQNLLILGVFVFVIYAIYKSCVANMTERAADGYADIPPDDPTSGPNGRRGFFGGGGSPPPPGFRPSYSADGSCGGGAGLGGGRGSGLGGFWTGAATGGLLGYMFGNRGNTGYGSSGFGYPREGTFSSGPSFSSPSSSGTHSSSGFGGTRRR
ncbi:unnamed protein product, partial [Ixodes hexagonus]